MKQSDIDNFDEQFDNKLEKLDFDQVKVNRLCEQAAFKVAPLFRLYGVTYGDKIPDVYYLAFTIKELLMDMLDATEAVTTGTGHFRVAYDPDETDQIVIGFDLATIDRKDLR